MSGGSVWDLDFSRDPGQSFLYVADGENNHVWMLARRRQDSRGNIYTAEVDNGKRVQKFVYQGLFPITD